MCWPDSIPARDLSHSEIAPFLGIGAYFAYLFGGLLRRLGCRIRPYEIDALQTDRTVSAAQEFFVAAFLGKRSKEDALAEAIEMFGQSDRYFGGIFRAVR